MRWRVPRALVLAGGLAAAALLALAALGPAGHPASPAAGGQALAQFGQALAQFAAPRRLHDTRRYGRVEKK